MDQINLEIGNLEALMAFMTEAKRIGLLKDVSLEQVEQLFSRKEFPVKVPVNLDAVMQVCQNPIVKKMIGKRFEEKTVDLLNVALGAGR